MLELLKELLLEYQEMPLKTGTPRHIKFDPLHGKASVFMGVRRAGKSTFLYQIMASLLDSGIDRSNILFLNFFDDRLHGLNQSNIHLVMEAYHSLYPDKRNEQKMYCFFDEIQGVQGWEPFVERILRMEGCEVCITGSSANLLSKEIATQLRGRALTREIFPFSFREFLSFKGFSVAESLSTKQRLILQGAFEEYFESGGFPETLAAQGRVRTDIHQEYFTALMFRDVVERHDISHPKALTDLAYRLLDNTASLQSINKLTNYLKSLGHKVPKSSVSDYLSWFEDAYFLFSVPIFDASLTRVQANPRKVYCIDHAFVRSLSSGILVNSGHLLENLVFIELRRRGHSVRYYRTRNGREVDFIVSVNRKPRQLIQVSERLVSEDTLEREELALLEAMEETGLDSGTIITRSRDELPRELDERISVIPAWRFVLEGQ